MVLHIFMIMNYNFISILKMALLSYKIVIFSNTEFVIPNYMAAYIKLIKIIISGIVICY